jgi:hypothetical protein
MGEYRDAALEEAERRARSELQRGAAAAKAALTPSGEDESSDTQPDQETDSSGNGRDMNRESASSSDTAAPQRESQDRFH